MPRKRYIPVLLIALILTACGGSSDSPPATDEEEEITELRNIPRERLQPSDLVYEGAFRLPEGSNGTSWEWSGTAMTYYPNGDPYGPIDGYPGSIYATGHEWDQFVSEIAIPSPVISASKDLSELNTASTLQEFSDIKASLGIGELELPRMGLAYLPAQRSQTSGELHFCWGQHMQEGQDVSHGWADLDISNPRTAGGWYLADYPNYSTNDYLFDIHKPWADAYTPGLLLGTGRFRDGGMGGQGPSLFAYGPWNEGNPPAPETRLGATPLLLYSSSNWEDPSDFKMNNYHHSDEWSGGSWLTTGNKAAVVFIGTKGIGDCWYGFANGVVWPDEPPFPPVPDPPNDDRGWWSTGFVGQFLFYDAQELAAVAQGTMAPHEPQPYATLDVDQFLYNVQSTQQRYHLGAASFDRDRGIFYVVEFLGDGGEKSLIHVWRIS